jgi:hypothetical protein
MSQLSPCPQCRSERVWARAALGAYGITHVAFCPGCARAATICTRCGSELVLMRQSSWVSPGRPRVESMLQCPSCRQVTGSPSAPATTAGPAGPVGSTATGVSAWSAATARPATVRHTSLSRFIADAPAPAVMQRVADDCEVLGTTRYVRRRQLLGMVEEASRRADAMARLEIELSRLSLER